MHVKLDLKIILVLLIFFLTDQIEMYLLFMFFAILHELGHLIMENGKIISLKKLLIAMAGPVTNFFIAIFFMVLNIDVLNFTREEIIYSNLLIGIFNLIPIYPLDGGRIIKNIIHINTDLIKAYKYTNLISNITLIIITAISSIAILYFKNIAILLIVLYLWILLIKENNIYNKKMHLYKLIDEIGDTKEMYEDDMLQFR